MHMACRTGGEYDVRESRGRRECGYNRPRRTTPRFNIEASSSLERNAEECAIQRTERTIFCIRALVFVLAGALVALALGLAAPGVRAAGPPLALGSPAGHALIADASPVAVVFVRAG